MARPKLGEGETQRLQIKISDEELTAIDDWRFGNRVPSRSEAVRRLIQIGLRLEPELQPIYDFTLSQLDRYKALFEIIDDLSVIGGDLDHDRIDVETEENRAKLIIRLMDWADESWRVSTELRDQAATLGDQYAALGGADEFAEAVRVANDARSRGERQRALWKARAEDIARRASIPHDDAAEG